MLTDDYSVHPVQSEDIEPFLSAGIPAQLSNLYTNVGWNGNGNRSPEAVARMLTRTGFVVFVTKGEELVGFSRLLLDEFCACVLDVIVKPEERRKGIARAMMGEIRRFLDREDRSAFLIDGSGFLGFYEALGFKEALDERVMYCANG